MKYLLLLFIAMSSFRAFGQYSLNGQVTDSTTSAPLDYIEIILKSPDNEWSNLSDEQGKYIFENLAPGMYQLIVNYNFEQVYNQSIEIESDLEKNLKIKIKEIQLNEVVVRQKVFKRNLIVSFMMFLFHQRPKEIMHLAYCKRPRWYQVLMENL